MTTAFNESGAEAIVNGQSVGPGAYTEHYTYTPTAVYLPEADYGLCAYVAPELDAFPDASATGSLTVISLAHVAELEERAAAELAEKKAEEQPAGQGTVRIRSAGARSLLRRRRRKRGKRLNWPQ